MQSAYYPLSCLQCILVVQLPYILNFFGMRTELNCLIGTGQKHSMAEGNKPPTNGMRT